MKKVLLALAGAALAVSAIADGPTLIYRAAPYDPTAPDDTAMTGRNDGTASNFITGGYDAVANLSHERGDEIVLGAGSRVVSEINVTYVLDVNPPGPKTVRIRLYDLDGAAIAPRPYSPSTVLFDSGLVVAKLGEFASQIAIPGGLDLNAGGGLAVANTLAWSSQSTAATQAGGNIVAPRFYGPTTVGASDSNMWRRNGDGLGGPGPWIPQAFSLTNGTAPGGWLSMSMYADGNAMNTGSSSAYDNIGSAGYPGGLVVVASTADDPAFPTGEGYRKFGDDYNLEGSSRAMDAFDVLYQTDIAAPVGDEKMKFHIYDADEAAYTVNFGNGPPAAASTYTSSEELLDTTAGEHTMTWTPAADVTIPQAGYWFVEVVNIEDVSPGVLSDLVAIVFHPVPKSGHSNVFFVGDDFFGTWYGYWFGNPTPNVTGAYSATYGNVVPNFAARFRSKVYAHKAILGPGSTNTGSLVSTKLSDDVRWSINPGAVGLASQDNVKVILEFHMPDPTVSTMNVVVESRATSQPIRQRVRIKLVGGADFQLNETSPMPTTDQTLDLSVPSPNTYIDGSLNNKVIVTIFGKNTGATAFFPWRIQLDHVYIKYTP